MKHFSLRPMGNLRLLKTFPARFFKLFLFCRIFFSRFHGCKLEKSVNTVSMSNLPNISYLILAMKGYMFLIYLQ